MRLVTGTDGAMENGIAWRGALDVQDEDFATSPIYNELPIERESLGIGTVVGCVIKMKT
eukprot:COSAG02_NODE_4761_length_5016_cov_3.037014_5_plen_59_part_00